MECSNCLPGSSQLEGLCLSSIRQLLTSLLSSFILPAVALHWILGFSPSTCQESAKDLRVCMKILQPPSVALFFMDFPWPIFSLSESPEHWSWLPSPAKLPLCLSVSSTHWEVPRINVDLNKCVFLLSRYECSLVPACFWFLFSAFKWLVFIFCPEFVIVTGRRLSLL